jgi:glycine betaine/proline transport system permease protein
MFHLLIRMLFILGSLWYSFRNIWNWALAFLIIETFAIVQIIRGFFGNISAEAYQKIDQIKSTIEFRQKQLEAAIENNSDKVEMFERTIKSLENSIEGYVLEAQRVEASGFWIAVGGIIIFLIVRIIQAMFANSILEKRYSEWLSNKYISPGMQINNILLSITFALVIIIFSTIHYSFPNYMEIMKDFPTHPDIRLKSIAGVESAFDFAVIKGEAIFDAITFGIRSVLDSLELLFVKTPWIVIISSIVLLTGLSAGPRAAIYSGAFLAYMGFLGFWIKAMTTLALLGTAALIKYCYWYSTWNLLFNSTKVLCFYKTYHGLYANYACVCIHDSSHCFFWNWESCSSYHYYDFWRNTCCKINST